MLLITMSSPAPVLSVDSRTYPAPLIFPSSSTHTHTLIVLHGRGSNAANFSTSFLSARTSSNHTLQQLFPLRSGARCDIIDHGQTSGSIITHRKTPRRGKNLYTMGCGK